VSGREHRGPVCEREGDAAPYVLGALDEAEAYREHLDGCASCRARVDELQLAADVLPASVPSVRAPRALRERVLATVRSEAELLHAAGSEADRPPARRGHGRSSRISVRVAGIALGACIVAGVVLALTVGGGSRAPERVIAAQVAPGISGARASLRETGGHAELVVSGMPQPRPGKIYEVWLSRGSTSPQPTDALFGVTVSGSGSVDIPGDLNGVRAVLVTAEPLGGSRRPTSAPVLRVPLDA
jgi:Anti-sigma-K factor rskA